MSDLCDATLDLLAGEKIYFVISQAIIERMITGAAALRAI